jgi:ABC-2 type transport system ATP-binding protein
MCRAGLAPPRAKSAGQAPPYYAPMTPPNSHAVHTEHLTKVYRDFWGRPKVMALEDLNLTIERGEVFGLLGPNGSGKSTTIKLLLGLIFATGGTAHVLDEPAGSARVNEKLGFLPEESYLYRFLNGEETLYFYGRLFKIPHKDLKRRVPELLDVVGLDAKARKRKLREYSKGMARRIGLAQALINNPELILLDEPTTGLDPRNRNQVWDIIRTMSSGGTTVLLTTQYLDEADRLADRIAVIDGGKVIAEGTPGELKNSVGSGVLRVRLREPEARPGARRVLSRALGVTVETPSDPVALLARISEPERAPDALAELPSAGIAVTDFSLGQPSLDEVFLALTGRTAEQQTGKEEGTS